jgi:hypothetical protein
MASRAVAIERGGGVAPLGRQRKQQPVPPARDEGYVTLQARDSLSADELERQAVLTVGATSSADDGRSTAAEPAGELARLLAAHGVEVSAEQRAADASRPDPNAAIPPRRCACGRCLCLPLIVPVSICPVVCCGPSCDRKPRHPAYDAPGMWKFEATMTAMRAVADNLARSMCLMRLLTDPPIGRIPLWFPMLPASIGCARNVAAPHAGEWYYPATGKTPCGCSSRYPGDPQVRAACHPPRPPPPPPPRPALAAAAAGGVPAAAAGGWRPCHRHC